MPVGTRTIEWRLLDGRTRARKSAAAASVRARSQLPVCATRVCWFTHVFVRAERVRAACLQLPAVPGCACQDPAGSCLVVLLEECARESMRISWREHEWQLK